MILAAAESMRSQAGHNVGGFGGGRTGQNRLTDRAVGLHLLFLIDMSALTDLYRVASFFGLGLSLVGIGYLYQRFVFPRPADSAPTEA